MRKRVCTLASATMLVALGVFAQTSGQQHQKTTGKSMSPQQFLTMAAQDSQAEIKMGQLAQQRGQSQQVKDLGQKIASDHENLYNQIQEVARSQNITVPSQPSHKQMQEYNRLASLSGTQFDREFLKAQEKGHTKEIQAYQRAQSSSNTQIAQLAQNAIPVLQSHQQMTQQAMASVPGATRTPATDNAGQYQQNKHK